MKYLSEIIINPNLSFTLMAEEYKTGKLNIVEIENVKHKAYLWTIWGSYEGTNHSVSPQEIPICCNQITKNNMNWSTTTSFK